MGNISNIWYSKNDGGSWAETKCALDDCYSIPYHSIEDDNLYLQVSLPSGIWVDEIWLADLNGNRIVEIKSVTEWKIVEGPGSYYLMFRVPPGHACRGNLKCFRFEIPLLTTSSPNIEIDTIISEPFHCPECEPTVKISSDYCLSDRDINGTFVFDATGMSGTHYGGLNKAKNDFRIQAVLKQLPSQVTSNRNLRCFNYKSKLQQRYKIQGALTDFPDYMVNIIESIFSGKKLYIDNEEYHLSEEKIFSERNIEGRSMMRLEAQLVKCELERIHKCSCTVSVHPGM